MWTMEIRPDSPDIPETYIWNVIYEYMNMNCHNPLCNLVLFLDNISCQSLIIS